MCLGLHQIVAMSPRDALSRKTQFVKLRPCGPIFVMQLKEFLLNLFKYVLPCSPRGIDLE